MPTPKLEIHFLDVGTTKYGDCILIRKGAQRILIDAAHPGDTELLGRQMDELLKEPRPHGFDLVVLTHCHNDHIGCMPELFSRGVIKTRKAHLADIALGWGAHLPDALPDTVDEEVAGVVALLREESAATLKPAEFEAALADALTLRTKTQRMFDALRAGGTEVIECTGDEDRDAIAQEFASMGLKFLGPTKSHLRLCADQIARAQRDAIAMLNDARRADDGASTYELFQRVVAQRFGLDGPLLDDGFDEGAALNCQSLVLRLESGGKKVLLAGDMQFADPDVNNLGTEMEQLRAAVAADGPYDVIKTCHHTSHNGWDKALGDALLPADRQAHLVHSGGVNDPKHPAEEVLKELRTLRNARNRKLTYLRTDHNGQISFTISASGVLDYKKARGSINDFQANPPDQSTLAPVPAAPAAASMGAASGVQPSTSIVGDMVEVIARIPNRRMRVVVTVDVQPEGDTSVTVGPEETIQPDPLRKFSLPVNRMLPPLLFVTDVAALGRKIGATNANSAVAAIKARGFTVLTGSLAGQTPKQVAEKIRAAIKDDTQGVVLLGGMDVVPSVRLDVLGPELRPRVQDPEEDPDNFIVWNDELYGDRDGDELAELPVSRIPDGGSGQLVAAALAAAAPAFQSRFGIRNVRRPFAQTVFKALPGQQEILVSQPAHSSQLRPRDVQTEIAYLMLHGDDSDARRFWGETNGGLLEAFTVQQVPNTFSGVVFAGCCWGALTTTRRALHFSPGQTIDARVLADSIPLRFLAAGALAFVGCTGVHYSPGGNQPNHAGGPMHVAFFNRLIGGEPPARALFRAKRDCLDQLDPDENPEELAVSMKIIRQFTCLGLGW